MILSISFGIRTIYYAFEDWENHPTIISVGSMDSPLSEIPYAHDKTALLNRPPSSIDRLIKK